MATSNCLVIDVLQNEERNSFWNKLIESSVMRGVSGVEIQMQLY